MGIPPKAGKVDAESGKRSVDLEARKKTLLSAEISPSFLKFLILHQMFVWIHLCPHNSSTFNSGTTETELVMPSTQDIEVLGILEGLENNDNANFTG